MYVQNVCTCSQNATLSLDLFPSNVTFTSLSFVLVRGKGPATNVAFLVYCSATRSMVTVIHVHKLMLIVYTA